MFPEILKNLHTLDAKALTDTLAQHFEQSGGLVMESEKVIARELVRRARELEKIQKERAA